MTTKDKIIKENDPLKLSEGTSYEFTPIEPNTNLQRKPLPIDHIGAIGEVIKAIANITQKCPTFALQGVLSALAGASQKNYQVSYFDNIKPRPLSIFTLTIASSGGAKTSVMNHCFEVLKDINLKRMADHKIAKAEYREKLAKKGETPPDKPICPMFMLDNGTTEGVIDMIDRTGMAIWNVDEIATLIGGHSAKPDNLLKMLGTLSTLWSDSRCSEVKRSDDEPRLITGDSTLVINAQPKLASVVFGDELWREQGTIPRFLVTKPMEIRQPRIAGETSNPNDLAVVKDFNDTIRSIFNVTVYNENKHTVRANGEAEAVLTDFYNNMISRATGDCSHIASYIDRATEHAARIAALLSIYQAFSEGEPKGDIELTKDIALQAVILMEFYLHEYNRLSNPDMGKDYNQKALNFFGSMIGWELWEKHDQLSIGELRKQSRRKPKETDHLVAIFTEHGYLKQRKTKRTVKYEINQAAKDYYLKTVPTSQADK